jgi:hypothetical protein
MSLLFLILLNFKIWLKGIKPKDKEKGKTNQTLL